MLSNYCLQVYLIFLSLGFFRQNNQLSIFDADTRRVSAVTSPSKNLPFIAHHALRRLLNGLCPFRHHNLSQHPHPPLHSTSPLPYLLLNGDVL